MLLSICMPTYNRKEKAINQVSCILSQIKYLDDVEFLVSDNCSTDGSYETFIQNFNNCRKVRFFRQDENLGLIGNVNFLFKQSFGKYIWFISDDDIILPNSVSKIVKKISESTKPYFLLNFKTESGGVINNRPYWTRGLTSEDCFKYKWGGFGLLSAELMEKECFNNIFNLTQHHYNLCLPVIYSLYGIFLKGGEIVTDDIFLIYHTGPTSWDKYKLEVDSIFNFEAVDQISSLITKKERKSLLNIIISNDDIKDGCIRYILKRKDQKFTFYLLREGLLPILLVYGLKKIFRQKTKSPNIN